MKAVHLGSKNVFSMNSRKEIKMKKIISISAMIVSLTLLAVPVLAAPPFVVVGEMNPAVDVPNVQNAVNNYEKVLLRGSFNFGYDFTNQPPTTNVVINKDVKICGETDENGFPMTTIYGGNSTFVAPPPIGAFDGTPVADGPKITIKNIHFDGAGLVPIHIAHTSGVEIKNNKITNVLPIGPMELFFRPNTYWQCGIIISTAFFDPRGESSAVVPNAVTGPIVIKDNEIDLELYPPYPPRSPADTMGQGVLTIWTWGATVEIKGNILRNVTRNSIELLDSYKDDNGIGSISIKGNDIVTSEVGITIPSNSTPNGIVLGWFNDPEAGPERTPGTSIKGNYVEGKGETSIGIIVLSPGATIKNNEIIVNDGFYIDAGASGIMIFGEEAVVRKNEITINPTSGMPGAAGSGIIILSDYATVKNNQIIFDDEVPSWADGIVQLASEGMISSNVIEGQGDAAVFLVPYFTSTIQNNMILENNIENFIPLWADVVFFPGANNNTLVGEGGTVVDWGVGNIITGDWLMP